MQVGRERFRECGGPDSTRRVDVFGTIARFAKEKLVPGAAMRTEPIVASLLFAVGLGHGGAVSAAGEARELLSRPLVRNGY